MRLPTIVLVAVALLGIASPAQAQPAPTVIATTEGRIAGSASADGRSDVFKNIPFAAPPVGVLRWRAPQPAKRWSGIRTADRFSADCVQPVAQPGERNYDPERRFSEDCLYLNLWVPRARPAAAKLPVLVWIYGGSFTHGGASQKVFDGARLAARGAIIVTFNYRVGALGFVAHPALTAEAGTSGNYGILDQIAALKWVRRNIAAFGGDPARVTIAGESAGAISVNTLMVTPRARGLFAGAIVQSGPIWGMSPPVRSRADLEAVGLRMAARRGIASLAALRALPADDVVAITPEEAGPLLFPFAPIVDGTVVPEAAAQVFARGDQAPVPLLIGDTADEFSQFVPAIVTPEMFVALTRADFGDDAERIIGLFAHASLADARRARIQTKVYPIHEGTIGEAEWHARRHPTYLYRFDRAPPGPNAALWGASHGSDVPYTFDAMHDPNEPWTDVDRALAANLVDFWLNFAKTGDPNHPGLPTWPRFQIARPELMSFGDFTTAIEVADLARIKASRRPIDQSWLRGFAPP